MSDKNSGKIDPSKVNVTNPKAPSRVDPSKINVANPRDNPEKLILSEKIDSASLIISLQKDLIRVNDFAMGQDRETTYVLSDFNVQLKGVVMQEKEKTYVSFPKSGEINPNLLSSINITLKPIPIEAKTPPTIKPIDVIEGIGIANANRLRDLGIINVSDLARLTSRDLVKTGITTEKANEIIGMAKLMAKSNLAGVEGVDDQAAELLIIGGKIDSKEKLSQANPQELNRLLNEAIKNKTVEVPASYKLTLNEVNKWVKSAKESV